jgi:drug/metabolite transporter (DMT)-like permease
MWRYGRAMTERPDESLQVVPDGMKWLGLVFAAAGVVVGIGGSNGSARAAVLITAVVAAVLWSIAMRLGLIVLRRTGEPVSWRIALASLVGVAAVFVLLPGTHGQGLLATGVQVFNGGSIGHAALAIWTHLRAGRRLARVAG